MNQFSIAAFVGTINQQEATLVNARDLHVYLGIQTRYSQWLLRRIEEYGFTENLDFIAIPKVGNSDKWFGSREITEYHITLDMAKELCMVERSEIGRAARRYFIEMEKESRDAVPTWAIEQWSVQQSQLAAAQDLALFASPMAREVVRLTRMGLSLSESAKVLVCADSTVHRYRSMVKAAGFLEGVPTLKGGSKFVGIAGQARNDGGLRGHNQPQLMGV